MTSIGINVSSNSSSDFLIFCFVLESFMSCKRKIIVLKIKDLFVH